MKNAFYFFGITSLLFPFLTFAQTRTVEDVIGIFGDLIASLVPILILAALAAFFYGIAKFILNAGNAEARSEGVQLMIYGIIALFVMVSVWGLVSILQNTFLDMGGTDIQSAPNCGGACGPTPGP